MSTKYTLLTTLCPICGAQEREVHMKNPFLDDSEVDCSNAKCSRHGNAEESLRASARHVAKAEEARDYDESERDDPSVWEE